MMTRNGNQYSPDWSNDFFEVGVLPYNEDADAYTVPDVDYCVDMANDWQKGIGDFYGDESDPENKAVFVEEV